MKYFLFIALVASSVRAACAFDNSQWANDFKQAQSAAQQGNFPQAEKLYLEAVREAEQFGKESRYVGITLTGLAGLKVSSATIVEPASNRPAKRRRVRRPAQNVLRSRDELELSRLAAGEARRSTVGRVRHLH